MRFETLKEVKKMGLVQITVWLTNNDDNRVFAKKTYDRISMDLNRNVCYVKYKLKFAVFANDVTKWNKMC